MCQTIQINSIEFYLPHQTNKPSGRERQPLEIFVFSEWDWEDNECAHICLYKH